MKDKEYLKKVGQRIKSLRLAKGISQDKLSKQCGYTDRSTLARIENGTVDISQSKLIVIASVLDTTPAYLLGWEESSKEQNLISLISTLTDAECDELSTFIDYLISKRK